MRPTSLVATLLFLAACSSGGAGSAVDPSANPEPQGQLVSPVTGIKIEAAIAAATLGDEGCSVGSESKVSAGTCTAPSTGSADGGVAAGDSAGGCGGIGVCRASTLQLQLTSATGRGAARVEVVNVELVDSANGAVLATLSTSSPRRWDTATSTYVAWDQTLAPSSEMKVSYTMSSPPWSTLGSNLYSKSYRVRLTLRADGASLMLESAPLSREPMVAT